MFAFFYPKRWEENFTFHWLSKAIGQTIRVPPFALDKVLVRESFFSFAHCWLSVLPVPGLASISAIVITVFPRPIASARIYKCTYKVRWHTVFQAQTAPPPSTHTEEQKTKYTILISVHYIKANPYWAEDEVKKIETHSSSCHLSCSWKLCGCFPREDV